MKKKRMSIRGTMVDYSIIIYKENEMYVAWSPEFDIACQGRTIEEATNDLDVSIRLYATHPNARMSKIDFVAVVSRLMNINMPNEDISIILDRL
jgi:predicted RNase H-like HicB family nuclease